MKLAPLLAALALIALPASAQTRVVTPQDMRASQALAALWRPLPIMTAEAADTACRGAEAEIEALEAALPPVLTPESLARVRALRGLLVIPTAEPSMSYFFPDRSMTWFASGLGAVALIDEGDGFIGVRDAAGTDIAIQYGQAGGRPMIRVQPPQGEIQTFVGCAQTSPAQN
ncbi:hypothetical protein [Terricaulis silvestris]|uniref:Uncharacterized protein n=1 Tax=Terricaulis silvestris TaxID=2686094 RepID=A0A6I6MMT2_9CAUL|nr:hypothetical protein [Terricaulis silvestris]QGZ95361.1 hypothetical protein DSM104635_02210 [Terricaulis silvestris]